MLGVNLEGVWRLVRAAVPALLERPAPRQGRVVAISSTGGSVGLPLLAAYVAAKHGVNGVVRSLAAELGADGITVNAVAPGSTTTAMLSASAAVYKLPDTAELIRTSTCSSGHSHPTRSAELVAWVCSPSSSGVTGAVLPVDAGTTSRGPATAGIPAGWTHRARPRRPTHRRRNRPRGRQPPAACSG